MKASNKLIGAKINLWGSAIILVVLIGFNFFGLYSNQFHFDKLGSYFFPLLTLVHFLYIYVLWFKIKEYEYPDGIMKSIEYTLYGILLVYCYEIVETIILLRSQREFSDHAIPGTFMPLGTLLLALQFLLVVFSIWSFAIRKKQVGKYNVDYLNEHLSSWHHSS